MALAVLVAYFEGVERDGTVFIAEDFDPDDLNLLSGLFSAHWEHDREHLQGPELVSADEAIAWGRRHADVVLIRLADSDVHWSAGAQRPPPAPDDDFPVWPEGRVVTPRRPAGLEHLDLRTPEPIPWDVRVPRRVSRRGIDAQVEELRSALAGDPAVSELHTEVERGKRPQAVFRFRIAAASHAEAMQVVLDIEERTIDRFPYPDPRPWWQRMARRRGAYVVETGWNPYDDIRPADGRDTLG